MMLRRKTGTSGGSRDKLDSEVGHWPCFLLPSSPTCEPSYILQSSDQMPSPPWRLPWSPQLALSPPSWALPGSLSSNSSLPHSASSYYSFLKRQLVENSLAFQWLGLHAFTTKSWGQGTKIPKTTCQKKVILCILCTWFGCVCLFL